MPAANPIPNDMHSVTPHRVCAGAAEAIEFYKKAFDAIELGRFRGPQGKLIHALIRIGDSSVMLVDELPEWGSYGPKSLKGSPVTIHLHVEDVDAVVARARRGCENHHARGRHVLGRSLRQTRRPLRPSMVGGHAPARCEPGTDAAGDAENGRLSAGFRFHFVARLGQP